MRSKSKTFTTVTTPTCYMTLGVYLIIFIQLSFPKYLLSAYDVPGTLAGSKDTKMNRSQTISLGAHDERVTVKCAFFVGQTVSRTHVE